MVQVNPVFFEHSIDVPEDEAESLRAQGLLRPEKSKAPPEKPAAPSSPAVKEQQ